MANPQLEDGYLKIANELMDALIRIRIPGQPRQVFDLIMRKTYGFNKKEDVIPLKQITQITGLRKSHAQRALAVLLRMNLVTKDGYGKHVTYSINKDFDTWQPVPKKGTVPINGYKAAEANEKVPNNGSNVPKDGYKSYPNLVPSKDNTKDTIQKTENISEFENPEFNQDPILYEIEHADKLPTAPIDGDES